MSRTPPTAIRTSCSRRFFISSSALALAAGWLPQARAADGAALQFWFIRHAESELNVPGAQRTVADGGMTYPLTRRGVEQTRALVARMHDLTLTRLYTSTHLRAVQTAAALGQDHTVALQLAPEAAELDLGVGTDTSVDVREVYRELTHKWFVEGDIHARYGTGESYADLQQRFLPFVRELMNRHALDSGVVAIVSHGAALGLMLPVLTGQLPVDFSLRHPLPNTGIIKTELRDSRLHCTQWAALTPDAFESPTADATGADSPQPTTTQPAETAAPATD